MSSTTTYQYKPLESKRHIRLLKIRLHDVGRRLYRWNLMTRMPTFLKPRVFEMIHASVDDLQYEAVSYAWGDSTRVAELPIAKAQGHIALTQSLVKALPYLARASRTGLLWIDQICIHQDDLQEREQQVALMGEVFGNCTRMLIWLDLDDHSGLVAWDCLSAIKSYKIKDRHFTIDRRKKLQGLTERPDWRFGTEEFIDTMLALWNCSWMSRAWVIQEYILSPSVAFLWGKRIFHDHELEDLEFVTTIKLLTSYGQPDLSWSDNLAIFRIARQVILDHSNEPLWLEWFTIFASNTGDFKTSIERDGLLAYLGIWKPQSFQPSYTAPLEEMYTDFSRCFCKDTGLLDFLAINESRRARGYHVSEEFSAQRLPLWVLNWSKFGLHWPQSLITVITKAWNAASDRKHEYVEALTPMHLVVRGKIIDRVTFAPTGRFSNTSSEDNLRYLEGNIHELSKTAQNRHCTVATLVTMAVKCAGYDNDDFEPGTQPREILHEVVRGLYDRMVILCESGKFGMAPSWCKEGYFITIIHGCRVPLVLRKDEKSSTYSVVGDCYLEGVMYGEAVSWEPDEADAFILS